MIQLASCGGWKEAMNKHTRGNYHDDGNVIMMSFDCLGIAQIHIVENIYFVDQKTEVHLPLQADKFHFNLPNTRIPNLED